MQNYIINKTIFLEIASSNVLMHTSKVKLLILIILMNYLLCIVSKTPNN